MGLGSAIFFVALGCFVAANVVLAVRRRNTLRRLGLWKAGRKGGGGGSGCSGGSGGCGGGGCGGGGGH